MMMWAVLMAAMAATQSPGVEVQTTLTPPEIPFYRQARYSIIVEAPASDKVTIHDMAGKFGGVPVSGTPEESTEDLGNGRVRMIKTYTLDPIRAGVYSIQSALVEYGDGKRVITQSPGLRVRDVTDDEKTALMELTPNADLVAPRGIVARSVPYVLGTAAALALIAAIALYVKRRRAAREVEAPRPPAWETARNRLRALEAQNLPSKGQFGPYYVQLSSILRHYIEDRYSLRAPEQTTPEFLGEASHSGLLTVDHQQLLDRILRHADRVKFAQYQPVESEMLESFALTRQFVEETVPAPQPELAEATA